MNVADTLYFQLAAYANLFPNRARALDHLFCVVGNGMQWVDGQLVHPEFINGEWVIEDASVTVAQRIARTFDERKKDDEAREKRRSEAREKQGKPKFDVKKFIADVIAKRKAEQEANPVAFAAKDAEAERIASEVIANHEENEKWDYAVPDNMDVRMANTAYDNWYPMSQKHSMLTTFPNDIKPDWLELIIETAQLIRSQPNRLTDYTTEAIRYENQRLAFVMETRALWLRNFRARRQRTA